MNIVFPFFAILTAQFLVGLKPIALRRWTIAQTIIGLLLIAVMAWLVNLVQPEHTQLALALMLVSAIGTFLLFRQNDLLGLTGRMMGVMFVVISALNLFLYPTFLRYQAGSAAADYANTQPTTTNHPTILYEPGTGVGGGSFWSYEFYAKAPTQYARTDSALSKQTDAGPRQVFTSAELADSLSNRGFTVHTLAVFPYYHVSQLTYDFLNPATRSQTLSAYVLAEVKSERAKE